MIDLHTATTGDGLMLVYSRPLRNQPLSIGLVIAGAGVVFVAFTQLFPDAWPLLLFLAVAGGAAGIGISRLPYVTRVVTDFDKTARQVRVATTHSDGREETATAGFDQVRTLQLYQQRSKGTQLQTLTLITTDGRSIFLGREQQRSDWFSPPFGDGIVDIVNRIRKETGVGGVEELPMMVQAAGVIIGVDRR